MKRMLVLLLLVLPMVSCYEFCDYGEVGGNLTIVSVGDSVLDNDEQWIWDWGNQVEIEVGVSSGFNDTEDFVAELIFVDDEDNHIYLAVDDGDLKQDFVVDGGESEMVSFVFEVDEDVLEDDYVMYVKFYKDSDEDKECVEAVQSVRIGSLILCEEGAIDGSYLEIVGVSDENLDNSENWIWSAGDEVNVSVAVDNKRLGDLDLEVRLVFVDEDGDEVGFASEVGDLQEALGLSEDEEDNVFFVFDVGGDLSEGSYGFYVVAAERDNASVCTSVRASGEVEVRSGLGVIVSSVSGSQNVSAGESVNYSIVVENRGSSLEERVIVYVYNMNLGVDETLVLYDLNVGEERSASVDVFFSENSSGLSERLLFSAEYDYDEELDIYNSAYDGSESYAKKYLVNVAGDVVGVDNEEVNEAEVNVSGPDVGLGTSEGFEGGLAGEGDVDGSLRIWVVGVLVVLWIVSVVVSYFVFGRKK